MGAPSGPCPSPRSGHIGGFGSPLARAPNAPGPPASSGTDGWGVAGAQRSLPSQSGLARGGREREGGRKAGEAGPAGTAACAPAKRGAGMSRGRFGAGRSAGWHLGPKVETRSATLGRPPGGGGIGLPPGSQVRKLWIREFSKENVQGETPGHRNTAGSLGRARGQTPGRRNASRPGASGEACPINPALPGDAGGAGGGLRAGSRRPPAVGAGRGGGGGRRLGPAVLRLAACGCPGISGRSLSHSSLSSAWVR